jgi:hypothetical protein
VLGKLEDIKEHAGYWMARCPAHPDRTPSLKVTPGDTQPLLLSCKANCATVDVLAAIGLTMADICGPREDSPADTWTPCGTAVATYLYTDEAGKVLFGVCRTAGKDFPQWRPDPSRRHGRAWDTKGVRRVLYRLPRVLAAVGAGETVWVAEGERDVHSLEEAGVAATTSPGGTGMGWKASYSKTLAGAVVVIVADNDDKGLATRARLPRACAGWPRRSGW